MSQSVKKAFNGVAENFVIGVVQQDQQIDVGVGVQLATAVAADGDQSNVSLVAPAELIPGLLQGILSTNHARSSIKRRISRPLLKRSSSTSRAWRIAF